VKKEEIITQEKDPKLHQERIDLDRCKIFCNYWGIKMYNCLPDDVIAREKKEFKNEVKNVLIRKAYYSLAEAVDDELGFSKIPFLT